MFLANKLNKGAGAAAAPADAQFNYVTMLLHGDGTNGAQNNTFLDSSTNNFTITRNGNTTQGSFSPYGSNWSNYFGGSASYITVPSTLALSTSNYTIEFWFAGSAFEMSWGTSGGYAPLVINSSGDAYFANSTNTSWIYNLDSFITRNNTWNHYAIVRNSGVVYLYRNGVQVGTSSAPSNSGANGNVVIGYYDSGAIGHVSNFRCVIGTAVYTSAFTPSTTPLTAITNTQLLTCQSNRFIDNSTNAYALTLTGTVSVQRFNPFGTSTAYSTSVIGGSGYFDGTGDYLSVPTGTALNLSSGDFTIEGWMYATDVIGYHTIFSNGDYPSTAQVILVVAAAPSFYMSNGSGWVIALSSSINVNINSWNHIAVTASGTTYTIWVNGVSGGSSTASFTRTTPASTSVVGRLYVSTDDYYAKGYTTNVRVVKGTALYTTTFTPPTAPLTAVTNTQLLLNTTNGAIFDNAMMNDLETVTNAKISTSVKKYGTGSISFNGSSGYLSTLGSPLHVFGTGDFTIECWLNITSLNGGTLIDFRPASTNGDYPLVYQAGSGFEFYASGATRISSGSITTGTWFHFALCRSGSSMKMFFDGTQTGSTYTASVNYTVGTKLGIGTSTFALDSSILDGYIDDLRITKGFARYTATFTPPTAALPDIGPN